MAIKYKLDLLPALKAAGYNTSRLRREKIMGEKDIQSLRTGALVSWRNIDKLCRMLNCQPGDIVKYVPDEEN